jgi:hypothetical protein
VTRTIPILLTALVLGACGGSSAPAPAAPAAEVAPGPETAPSEAVLVLREMVLRADGEELRLAADGAVHYEGKVVGRVHADGRFEVEGQVVATMHADGRVEIAGEPGEDIVIGADGSLSVSGRLVAEIGPDGAVTGEIVESQVVLEGPADGRRAAMLMLMIAIITPAESEAERVDELPAGG